MTTGDSFYSKLTRSALAVALAATVVTGFGLTPVRADDGRGSHDNGNHYGWYKDKKRDKHDGDWDDRGNARVVVVQPRARQSVPVYTTPVTPLDRRHRTRSTPYYNNGGYYNQYPNGGYNNGGYYNGYPSGGYNNGGYYNGYPSGGYYNNGGYYDNRRGDLDPRDVARRAAYYGYQDGFARGQYDRRIGARRGNPQGHGAYQFALNGWERDWGSANTYQSSYRQYFLQGYQDGFGQRTYRDSYRRRPW